MSEFEKVLISEGLEKTFQIASDFVKEIDAGDIICLYGNLGSGKTTFVQGLAKALGIKRRITSPTFIVVRSYEIPSSSHTPFFIRKFYHLDLYRLENQKDLTSLGIQEILNTKDAIVAIEWAEKLGELLPQKRFDLHFEYVDENKRKIKIEKIGEEIYK